MTENEEEWVGKGVMLLCSLLIAVMGWAFSLETRLQATITKVEERGPRLESFEKVLNSLATDTDIDKIGVRLDRLEDRVNGLHQFLLQNPANKPPFRDTRRGDLFPDMKTPAN